MGREELLKKQALQQAQQSFAKGVANGAITIMDRFGHRLKAGDVVLLQTGLTPVYQIIDIAPVLDPRAPAGVVAVTFLAQDQQMLRPGQPVPALVYLAELTEASRKASASSGETGNSTGDLSTPPSEGTAEPPSGEALEGETPHTAPEARPPAGGIVLTDLDRFGKKG
jgi:hypothetical protein